MNISVAILTFNRKDAVGKTLAHNLDHSGYPIHELIHVDNGSDPGFTDWFQEIFHPDIQLRHKTNLGVSRGYNRGMLLATGSHVIITGVDRLMPNNWVKTLVEHYEAIPNTGVISIYLPAVDDHKKLRYRGEPLTINGKTIQPSAAKEARIIPRDFLLKCGFFREDFQIYGNEDHEWERRAHRTAQEAGLINYIIPGMIAEPYHGDDYHFLMPNGQGYHEFKKKLEKSPENTAILNLANQLGNPFYNPYSRIEPVLIPSKKEGRD